jgi:multiple sugar transport system substrate-binding protein
MGSGGLAPRTSRFSAGRPRAPSAVSAHRGRRPAGAILLLVLVAPLLGGCARPAAPPTLNWYINPDNGGQRTLAAKCSAASGGRYRVEVSVLPNDATSQREQLVRRLAAKDGSIDLMSLDPPFVPEFANAGFLRPFTGDEAEEFTDGVLKGPVDSATWEGRLVAAPFWANSQLLWYRRSVARRAGLDPSARGVTWEQLIAAAERTGTTVEVQGNRYEGYMVLISALVVSGGGQILQNPEAGKDVVPSINSEAGRKAAALISRLARSRAASPALSTTDEEAARAAFQRSRGGFMVNWPYVYGAAQEAVDAGVLDRSVLDDIGWARYPKVDAGRASRPPLGGISIGIGAFSRHAEMAVEAVRCITSQESQTEYMIGAKNPSARAAVYDDAAVRKIFPMADLIRQSIQDAAPRPKTPYYTDVSSAVVRSFHPAVSVDERTPERAGRLIVDVLNDKVLL